ncbi:MAG: hypothetical protein JM58_19185 [Peptococcaceae bacterium BICA1-8]|nr:MAG: hypothetical protein JM58_19185 [Peptococcaceae bacterium BICA1-8]
MSTETTIGIIARIEVYDKKESSKESMKEREETYNLRYLGENENYYFGWAHGTDVQISYDASEQLKEKFRAMEGKFDEIIKTFKIW